MTATVYPLTDAWASAARYTAAAAIDVKLVNPAAHYPRVAYTTTLSDTAPTIATAQADKIGAGKSHAFTLKSGERLWMAAIGKPYGEATLEV